MNTDLLNEIYEELRTILRLREELSTPVDRFCFDPRRTEAPQHYVQFDVQKLRVINGLKLRSKTLTLPDEHIRSRTNEFAQTVWHLKDRLNAQSKLLGKVVDVEAHADGSSDLLICSDLANQKKHGRNKNRSGLAPKLGHVVFDMSKSGRYELHYNGAKKEKSVVVEHPVPIGFKVMIEIDDGSASLDDAISIISSAFDDWLPVIKQLKILDHDGADVEALRTALFIE